MLTALNALIENQGLGSLTTCLATVKETSVQYPKTMLKIFCSLLRKHQRGIIFTILELSFPSFSSSHPPTHGTCLPKAPCTPIPNSLQTSQLCCCFSHSSLAQRVMKLFRKCFLLPHHTKTVAKNCFQSTVPRNTFHSDPTHSSPCQPGWLIFPLVVHFPITFSSAYCSQEPGSGRSSWLSLTEEIILLGCQRGLMSHRKEENQMGRFMECFISTVNCFIYFLMGTAQYSNRE